MGTRAHGKQTEEEGLLGWLEDLLANALCSGVLLGDPHGITAQLI